MPLGTKAQGGKAEGMTRRRDDESGEEEDNSKGREGKTGC